MTSADIRPFTIDIPQADLDDLRDRLDRTRWAVPTSAEYGFGLSRLRLPEVTGHYAAHTSPGVLAADIRGFFAGLS